MKSNYIIIMSFIAGIIGWIIDAIIDYFYFYNSSFINLLIFNIPPHELYIRISIAIIFLIFGWIIYYYVKALEKKQIDIHRYNEKLEITLNSIGDAVIATDLNKNVTGMNPIAENLTGYTFLEAKGKPLNSIFKIINALTREPVDDPVEKVLKTGQIVGLANHTALIAKDGQEFQIADSGSPIRDFEGNIHGVILVFRDVTEGYEIEKQLEISENKFRNAFDKSHLGQFIYILNENNDLIFTDYNEAASKILGIDCQQFVGKKIEEAFPDLAKTELPENYKKVAKSGETYYVEQIDYNENKIEGAFEVHVIQIFPNCITVNFEDVTEKLQTREQLFQSEKKFRNIIESSPFGMHMYRYENNDLIFIDFNPSAEKILGVGHTQFLNKKILEAFPSLAETEVPSRYSEVARTGHPWATEQISYQDEKIVGAFKVNAFQIFEGTMAAFFEDITVKKQLEQEKINLIKELEAKNTEMERFTYTVSHDLRSPLITINGFLGVMMNEFKEGRTDKFKSHAMRITNATDTMKILLEDLLELSRIGRIINPSSNIDVNKLVKKVVEILHGPITKSNVNLIISDNLPSTTADSNRLSEVYQNLIENAIKFMGNQPMPLIEIGYKNINSQNVYFVKDNGIGIEEKYKEKIFSLFDKLDKSSEGSGVGLALVKRIIELHNGKIWFESEGLGKGSTFYFTINIET